MTVAPAPIITTPVVVDYRDRHDCSAYLPPVVNSKKVLACGQAFTCNSCKRVWTVFAVTEMGGEPQPVLLCAAEPVTVPPLVLTPVTVTVQM